MPGIGGVQPQPPQPHAQFHPPPPHMNGRPPIMAPSPHPMNGGGMMPPPPNGGMAPPLNGGMAPPPQPQPPPMASPVPLVGAAGAEHARKMRDHHALSQIITQWNANRLDLFALSLPNEVGFDARAEDLTQDCDLQITEKLLFISYHFRPSETLFQLAMNDSVHAVSCRHSEPKREGTRECCVPSSSFGNVKAAPYSFLLLLPVTGNALVRAVLVRSNQSQRLIG